GRPGNRDCVDARSWKPPCQHRRPRRIVPSRPFESPGDVAGRRPSPRRSLEKRMRKPWNLDADAVPAEQAIACPPYRLAPASGRLLRGDAEVRLRWKTFAVLQYLARHAGRLVSKDELLDAVWPETHVTPSVVTGCIRELRRALADDARAAHVIETAH